MVPWVLKQKKEKKQRRKQGEASGEGNAGGKKDEDSGDKTFLRYYHLYKKGELEHDIEEADGVVSESGYEKDNWWAIASPRCT